MSCSGRGQGVGWAGALTCPRETATHLPDTCILQRGLRTLAHSPAQLGTGEGCRPPGWTPYLMKQPPPPRQSGEPGLDSPCPSPSRWSSMDPTDLLEVGRAALNCLAVPLWPHPWPPGHGASAYPSRHTTGLGGATRFLVGSSHAGGHLQSLDPHPHHFPSREQSACS